MRGRLRALAAAVQFLTRIPMPATDAYDPGDLARSTAYFPVVGLVVGLVGGGVFRIAATAWPPLVAAALTTAATILLTGAFHEDALADAFDGFGGGWERERILAIMKDSRVGSYGALAIAVAVVLKVGALASLAPGDAARALVAGHVVARWSSLPLIRSLPYVRDAAGTGKPFAASVTPARLAVGTAMTVAILFAALGVRALPVLAAAALVTAAAGRYFRARIGGITGDCLGAANQVVEVATYLTLSARFPG